MFSFFDVYLIIFDNIIPSSPNGNPLNPAIFQVGFLLLPRFSLIAFASASETLRIANRLLGRRFYHWWITGLGNRPVLSSSGVEITPDFGLEAAPFGDMTMVVASFDPERHFDEALDRWLRAAGRSETLLAGVDTGAQVLARAGLLDNRDATAHWEALNVLNERYPTTRFRQAVFVRERRRCTAAGGTSCIDLMLNIVEEQHGAPFANSVADQMVYRRNRHGSDAPRSTVASRLGTGNRRVILAVNLMEKRLENPLSTAEIAAEVNISLRELERTFHQHLRTSPGRFYRQLRLEKASALLEDTSLSVTEVALACGFGSLASFSRSFKAHYGESATTFRSR